MWPRIGLKDIMMPNRTLCSVLDEMRKCCETGNYSYMPGLIEESQTLGNRMEAAIWDVHDLEQLRIQTKELKQEIKDLETKKCKSKGT